MPRRAIVHSHNRAAVQPCRQAPIRHTAEPPCRRAAVPLERRGYLAPTRHGSSATAAPQQQQHLEPRRARGPPATAALSFTKQSWTAATRCFSCRSMRRARASTSRGGRFFLLTADGRDGDGKPSVSVSPSVHQGNPPQSFPGAHHPYVRQSDLRRLR